MQRDASDTWRGLPANIDSGKPHMKKKALLKRLKVLEQQNLELRMAVADTSLRYAIRCSKLDRRLGNVEKRLAD